MNLREAHAQAASLFEQDRLVEAEQVCLEIFRADQRFAPVFDLMGQIRLQQGRYADAEHCFRNALAIDPNLPEAVFNMGNLCMVLGRAVDALPFYQRAEELFVGRPMPACNLSLSFADLGRHTDAIETARRALRIQPDFYPARYNLAMFLSQVGRTAESVPEYRRVIEEAKGHPEAEMGLMLVLNSLSGFSPEQVFEEHREWGRKVSALHAADRMAPVRDRNPNRVIRLGFSSADFRDHAVASFFEPLLARLDRSRFFVVCYSDVRLPDAVTARMQAMADLWRPMYGARDAAWAEQVSADRIDILVDLGGHTAGGRLRAFSRRPAPVQVSWLGYPNTTGLPEMDWRIADGIADPEGEAEAFHTERLCRLPRSAWCFRPYPQAPAVAERPADAGIPLVFGCFNVPRKFDPVQFRHWAGVLDAVPGSRLLLKAEPLGDPGVRTAILSDLAAAGVPADRVDFAAYTRSRAEHLGYYGKIDIALDTFPYGGTTTTCEALHMGVPVVTLTGRTHASRVGQSLLTRLGHPEWVARDGAEFVRIAAGLAADRGELARLRGSLRSEMERSPLMDEAGFAADFGAALAGMWTEWCSRGL